MIKDMTADELRALIGEPPDGSHPDEIMPRAETFHAERLNFLQEIAVLRETLAHQKVAYEEAVSRREFDNDEVARWQDEIRKTVIKASGAPDQSIDGGGCDSGDPLDLTLAEIRQGFNHLIERWAEYLDARARKSEANARGQEPDQAKVKAWLDVAAGERACAMMLRSGESPEALHAALADEPGAGRVEAR